MVSKINTPIEFPLPSDDTQIGGEWPNEIIKLLHGVLLPEEDLSFLTPIKWLAGSLLIYDGTSHSVSIETEDIATGATRHAVFREMLNTTDYFVMEGETQEISNKDFTTNIRFLNDVNFNDNGINHLEFIKIRDILDNNLNLIVMTGSAANTHFDLLSEYNTVNFATISGGTSISVTLGYNSEIDVYEIWSKASGSNIKLLSLTGALLSIDSDIVDLNNARVDNFDQKVVKLVDNVSDFTGTTTDTMLFRNDIDVNNQAIFISKIENGSVVKVRVT